MQIKKATRDDIILLTELFDGYRIFYGKESDLQGAESFLTDRINNNDSVIFIAVDDNKGAGFVQLYKSYSSVRMKEVWILNDLYVDENFRRKGVAEALIKKTVEFCSPGKYAYIHLETHKENYSAQNLYRKTGFEQDKDFIHFYYYFDK